MHGLTEHALSFFNRFSCRPNSARIGRTDPHGGEAWIGPYVHVLSGSFPWCLRTLRLPYARPDDAYPAAHFCQSLHDRRRGPSDATADSRALVDHDDDALCPSATRASGVGASILASAASRSRNSSRFLIWDVILLAIAYKNRRA